MTPVSGGALAGLLAVLAVLGGVMFVRGRDRRLPGSAARLVRGAAVQAGEAAALTGHDQPAMQSAPRTDMRPGQAGTVLDGVAGPRDVTGTIVDLAVRGYIRIEDAPYPGSRDWRLVRLEKTGGLLDYEQILLDGLFKEASTHSGAASTRLSELGPVFAGQLKLAQDALYADVAKRGWFTARPDRVRRRWLIAGGVLFLTGAVATVVLAATTHLGLVPLPVALAGLALIGCARWMPVRTAKGTDLAHRLLGFRRYITTAPGGQTQTTPAGTAGQAHPAGQADLPAMRPVHPGTVRPGCVARFGR